MLREAVDGAVFLINSPFGPDRVWDELPRTMQAELIRKHIRLYVIDADRWRSTRAWRAAINTIMQTCFFAISGVLPRDEAIAKIKGCHPGDLRPERERTRRAAISRLSTAPLEHLLKSCCRRR